MTSWQTSNQEKHGNTKWHNSFTTYHEQENPATGNAPRYCRRGIDGQIKQQLPNITTTTNNNTTGQHQPSVA